MKTIETERLILRQWKISDLEDFFEYAQNELVGPNAGWKPHSSINKSREIIKSFINGEEVYAIELKKTKKVIGSIGIHERCPDPKNRDLKQREIGYVLNPDYWGNGYVPEAVDYLVEYCFKEMGLDIVWSGHFDFNKNSQKVSEKCGFEYRFSKEEILKGLDNKKVTTLYYSKVKNK
ncbi:Protein N-acetyltransferase, RimJ/RimL family [Dethiosulfatibacter aminovorans DSM 17477]|uniref:Protein N-acetyltransferase, RimJ/RimL family n=1 Tax=Dethiosulfatibacter aminovorans DSM 17477 TaxID=1121476 RepID=A0A1M6J699_9FIRM|nr:GNAT family N-acetyltransferase [Dethiosulfatibacter aminovorans]SHJ42233.1 Protein N-acetyltransferase, RimJ/RimL family [Dethiosulfatibacter aminovorans DSM 17477]